MAKLVEHDSYFTADVRRLINRINDRTIHKDSVYDRAAKFFEEYPTIREQLDAFEQQLTEHEANMPNVNSKKKKEIQGAIEKLKADRKKFQSELNESNQARHTHLREVCYQVLHLSEDITFDDTLRKSAQFLGTIQLISPIEGIARAGFNERHKPLYKAILCLRLLDELIISEQINDPFINEFIDGFKGEKYKTFQTKAPEQYQVFTDQIKIAVVSAALLQDIGYEHPKAKEILYGSEEAPLDPYRTLALEQRKELLQIGFSESNCYILEGLGVLPYVGNSKEEQEVFIKGEVGKQTLIRRLFKSAVNPKNGIGNLLKVPQLYASIILSSKESYNYKLLPKVFNVLNLNVERGVCHKKVVECLYKITGMFPQGYGITYIPKALDDSDMEFYEYGIVNQLYPENSEKPICRQATRNLSFISFGHDIVIEKLSNLYFHETTKRFSKVSKQRLVEILKKICSSDTFEERKDQDILPRCWFPNDFFSVKNHQKLWNKASKKTTK